MKTNATRKRWYKRLTVEHYGTIIGSLLIFVSWIIQNNFKSDWDQKLQNLQRSQLVIDIEEVHRSIYEISYLNELDRKPIDSVALAIAALGQTRTKLNLLTWGLGRVTENSEDYSKMVNAKNTIINTSEQNLLKGDLNKIFKARDFVTIFFANNYVKTDNRFPEKVREVNNEQNTTNYIFTWLYIIGSSFIGFSYIYGKLTVRDS